MKTLREHYDNAILSASIEDEEELLPVYMAGATAVLTSLYNAARAYADPEQAAFAVSAAVGAMEDEIKTFATEQMGTSTDVH